MNKIAIILAASILSVGCARTTPMALGLDHPANPDAPAAPLPSPSTTLALSPTTTTQSGDGQITTPVHQGHDMEMDMGHAQHGAETQPQPAGRPTTQTQSAARYVCPMHPEVVSDKAGKCPKCKMNLVTKEAAR
jgi:hypothetical protein